jgi:hypothetical protein
MCLIMYVYVYTYAYIKKNDWEKWYKEEEGVRKICHCEVLALPMKQGNVIWKWIFIDSKYVFELRHPAKIVLKKK